LSLEVSAAGRAREPARRRPAGFDATDCSLSAMDLIQHSPFVDLFRRGGVPQDVRLAAAQGALELPALEQLALLGALSGDADEQVAHMASATIDAMPREAIARVLGLPDTPPDLRQFFVERGVAIDARPGAGAAASPLVSDEPPFRADDPAAIPLGGEAVPAADPATGEDQGGRSAAVTTLPVIERIKAAMRGTREQRSLLIRDPNRLVAAAVLSSPRLSDAEVESFARTTNVSEDVLRTIGSHRRWLKNYAVVSALVKNPRTPPAISMPLVSRLSERDLKMLAIDRNVPEGLRIGARKYLQAGQARRS
jgi:hypothetical protein